MGKGREGRMGIQNGQDTLVEVGSRVGTTTTMTHSAVHHLYPATACGRDARAFVRDSLCRWGWPGACTGAGSAPSEERYQPNPTHAPATSPQATSEQAQTGQDLQDILLLTSELAINAAQHARSPMDVTVRYWPGSRVRVEVHDDGGGKPEARWPTGFEETGRGLALVELLSESWGVTECRTGKTVWFELRVH